MAPARTAEGGDAILKIAIPEVGFADELRVLESAQGHGYVRLLAADREREALLLEVLGPPMASLALPPEQQITLLCQMLRQAWQAPRPASLVVMPDDEKAGQLARMVSRLWEELGHPCSERVVSQALRYAERRAAAFDLERCVVVHGDPHPWNALQVLAPRVGAEAGFVFVDPVGFLADPAYDLGVVLRDWCAQLLATGTAGAAAALARRYCALLSAETGVEETAIWEWGFLERVSSGLVLPRTGYRGDGPAVPPNRRDAHLRTFAWGARAPSLLCPAPSPTHRAYTGESGHRHYQALDFFTRRGWVRGPCVRSSFPCLLR